METNHSLSCFSHFVYYLKQFLKISVRSTCLLGLSLQPNDNFLKEGLSEDILPNRKYVVNIQ